MKKASLAIVAVIFFCGCGPRTSISNGSASIEGSGISAKETRDVTNYNQLQLDIGADVMITHGDKYSFTITADDNLLPLIQTEVNNQRLRVTSNKTFSTRQKIAIAIEMPQIREITINGSGNVRAEDVDSDKFAILIRGAGNITANGKVEELSIQVDGSGDLKFGDLEASNATITVTGAGNSELWVDRLLNATINGSGNITYTGNPQVTSSIRGAGHISKK